MKLTYLIPLLLGLAIVAALVLMPGLRQSLGEKLNDALFDHMHRSGMVLMAEVKSTQTTQVANGYKNLANSDGGSKRLFYARYVQGAATQDIGDTIYLGDLPKGSRILKDWLLNCGAGTATGTMHIGLRSKATGTVIAASGIAASVDTAAAGYKDANTGTLLGAGEEYVTTEVVEVYATINVAVLAAAQKITVEGSYVQD